MSRDIKVHRTELKYLISQTEYQALIHRLKAIMPADEHSQFGKGYFIRSLYFDSHNDASLYEKQAGVSLRRKYRIRIYDTKAKDAKFEIKNKFNNNIYKESAFISKDTALKAINGEYECLLEYDDEILNRIYSAFVLGNFRPKAIVDYEREAFKLDLCNIRITIDRNVRSNNSCFDIFSPNLHTTPVMLEDKYLLEIKFDKVLPSHIKQQLQLGAFERIAFSKYTLGRRLFKKDSWEDN